MVDFKSSLIGVALLLAVGLISRSGYVPVYSGDLIKTVGGIDGLKTVARRKTAYQKRFGSKTKKYGKTSKGKNSGAWESYEELVPGGWESITKTVPGQWLSLNETLPPKWANITKNSKKWEEMKKGSYPGEWTTITETIEEKWETINVADLGEGKSGESGRSLRKGDTSPRLSPETCTCKILKRASMGACYFYINRTSRYCARRDCAPKYVCVDGRKTGVTCVRRKITKKIIHVGWNKCKTKHIVRYIYVPYSA